MNKNLKKQIIKYLLDNPLDDNSKNKYEDVLKRFNINYDQARKYWREAKYGKHRINNLPKINLTSKEIKKIISQTKDNLDVNVNVNFEVKSLDDLLAVCEVDTTQWEVVSWQCKKWDLGIKNSANQIETKELYSVSAKFRAIKEENNIALQKDLIIKELLEKAPDLNEVLTAASHLLDSEDYDKKYLLEIAIPDAHFGKLSHEEESGEDYDLKIATKRFVETVKSLVRKVDVNSIDRILFPIGNDLINVDNKYNTTTGGTPQDCDTRFYKVVRTVKNLLIDTINYLTAIAPVDVVIVAGNHDEQTSFMIGEMLDSYYHNTNRVTVYNAASLRKYYKYGTTSIMFTHGNKEKHSDLGMIFAAENPKLWAETTQRYIQLGHLHHNRKISYLSAQEFQGFEIQVIPSISGSDAWHYGKGFDSLKQAKAFLFDKEEGKVGEFTHTIK